MMPDRGDAPRGHDTAAQLLRDAMASVERVQWFEPDGHEHTGYADAVQDRRRPAGEVLAEHKKVVAVVAIEDEAMWDATWGELRE